MILKKPALVLSSCPNLPVSIVSSPTSCITSSCYNQRLRALDNRSSNSSNQGLGCSASPIWNPSYNRYYASVSDPPSNHPSASPAGQSWPSSPNPTPYEIFSQPRDARYNKATFYELVKVYHPDRKHVAADSLISHSVRLERYRLVVAANEILSNPAKRRAYDLYGAGWNGNRTMQSMYREADRTWRNEPGNPSMNATWEDWERWYREKNSEKHPQSPVYMSNELFVAMLCVFVVVGSFAQARRASTSTMSVIELREQKHAAISGDMRRRQDEKAPLNRHERVESFLRQREGWNLAASMNGSPASTSDDK
ncbi:hypothetical protein F5Y19DRAFT_182204 [Xylariaceae sp. FL1651]|nr:hypothetical protein F5Y19DRAFT_182204 [Xylariaceae sp. FL1651]